MSVAKRSTLSRRIVVAVAFAFCFPVFLSACTAKDETSSTPSTDSSSPDPKSNLRSFLAGYPEAATKVDLATYVEGLRFEVDLPIDTTRIADIRYDCSSAECGSAMPVDFLAVPEGQANNVNWIDATHGKMEGHIVATFWNQDGVYIKSLGKESASNIYLWVGQILPSNGGDPVGGTALLSYNPKDSTASLVQQSKTFGYCNSGQKPEPAIKKNHASCPRQEGGGTLPAGLTLIPMWPDNLWVSCTGGCCEGGGTLGRAPKSSASHDEMARRVGG